MEAVRSRCRRRPARTALARLVSTGSRATPMQRANHFCRLRVQTRTSSLGGRTSASAECRHWSVGAVRWSSCAILLSKVQSVDQRMRLDAVSAFANRGRAVAHVRGAAGCIPYYLPSTRSRSWSLSLLSKSSKSTNATTAACLWFDLPG